MTVIKGLSIAQAEKVQEKLRLHGNHTTTHIDVDKQLLLKDFRVHKHVLSPEFMRDTRLLVKILYARRGEYAGKLVLDMGTGSGVLGIVMARGGARKVACVDIAPEAVANAKVNIRQYGLQNRMHALQSDLFSGLSNTSFDVIVFNHPYFSAEPIPGQKLSIAMLDSGQLLQRFLLEAKKHLNQGGIIFMPFHDFAGHVNDPERYVAQYGYTVDVTEYPGMKQGKFKVCVLRANFIERTQ